MSGATERAGVWFLYDGECPLCRSVAHAVRLKKHYGSIHLIDARHATDHPLYVEATERGLDLDEGMVIFADGRFHHGRSALTFVSRFGDPGDPLTLVSKALFRSRTIAAGVYPWLRGIRNALLRRRGVGQIDNLDRRRQPTFKPIFGDAWNGLPPVLQARYANRPFSTDLTVVEGRMDIACSGPIRLFAPLINLMGQIPAKNERDVPVTVEYRSDPTSRALHFRRIFRFRNGRIHEFRSRMLEREGGGMVEIMRFGFCWRFRYGWDRPRVILDHVGYGLHLFRWVLPLPLGILVGPSHAEEVVVDDASFDLVTHITHPWWGRIYEYRGRFSLSAAPASRPIVDLPDAPDARDRDARAASCPRTRSGTGAARRESERPR